MMFQNMVSRMDRTRVEKLGSGLGNFSGLLVKFGVSLAFLVAGRRGLRYTEAVLSFARYCSSWKGGTASLVKYLKACQITLMQAVSAGPVSTCRELGGVHKRRLGNLPGIIPPAHRVSIMRGDVPTIRFWLSLLGSYRIMDCPGKSSYQTITQGKMVTITQPLAEFSSYLKWAKGNIPLCGKVLKRIPVPKLRFRPLAILTSGPNVPPEVGAMWAVMFDALAIWNMRQTPWYKSLEDYCLRTMNTKFLGLIRDIVGKIPSDSDLSSSFKSQTDKLDWASLHNHREGNLLERVLYVLKTITRGVDSEGNQATQTGYMFARTWSRYLRIGRLHEIPEPAGKVRVVAMVTWWIQCLLFPLHHHIFDSVLRLIPQDGTHNQGKPLEVLSQSVKDDLETTKRSYVYSFDLKAATDRIPSELTVAVMGHLMTPAVAKSWLVLLVGLPYSNKSLKTRCYPGEAMIKYGTGMPMGAYSNWAMLAVTHHLLLQFAAYKSGYRGWYPSYALLGDDIVIRGTAVARQYEALCKAFGIKIGLAKSLISTNGTFEFAKRFYVKGQDVSPVSIREYWVSLSSLPGFVELIQRAKRVRPELRLADAVRAYSKGYRVIGSLTQRLAKLGNTRVANLITALILPGGPFESSLEAVFSLTTTAVHPAETLDESPILERNIGSVVRSIGQTLEDIAGSRYTSAKSYLGKFWSDPKWTRGTSTRLWSEVLDQGIAPLLAYSRSIAILERRKELLALSSLGTYFHAGRLNSRRLITLLGVIIPLWNATVSDVGALPDPIEFNPVGKTLKRARLGRLLKLRVRILGLRWSKSHTRVSRVTKPNMSTEESKRGYLSSSALAKTRIEVLGSPQSPPLSLGKQLSGGKLSSVRKSALSLPSGERSTQQLRMRSQTQNKKGKP